MFRIFQRRSRGREIYFHEDDYCQQQLLPREAAAHAAAEIKAIGKFADAHRVPDDLGWTDVYAREEGPVELRALKIKKEEFALAVSPFLPPFDSVYTGYSSHREECKKTNAWGTSQQCAIFADWEDDGTVAHAWAEFFAVDNDSIDRATKAVATLGQIHPLIYVDWAWGYLCEVTDEQAFASMLRIKLDTIATNA